MDTPSSVLNVNSVPEGDLEDLQLKDTHNRTTCARATQLEEQPEAVIDDEEGGRGYDEVVPGHVQLPET